MADRIVVMSWSGGKDSALALAALRDDPAYEVVELLTTVTREYDRVSIHGVRRALLQAQADALGLPLREVVIPAPCSNDDYERAMAGALGALRAERPEVSTVAFGDLFLRDVRDYRESRLGALGFSTVFPIWGRDTAAVAYAFVNAGFAARLVCVDTHALPADFAGRLFDRGLLADLPPAVDPCGENGEFHTFVSFGPGFREAVAYRPGEVVLRDERFAFADLIDSRDACRGSSRAARPSS